MTFNYSEETLLALKKSGWHENRKNNIDGIIDTMLSDGYLPIVHAIRFLEEYSDLIIIFRNKRHQDLDDITINPIHAMEIEVIEKLKEDFYPRIKCSNLNLIGTAYREHYILMMDENKCVYGAYDDYLVKIANSGEEAVEAIIQGIKAEEIPYLDRLA